MTNRVHQMGFALAGCGLQIERVEQWAVDRGNAFSRCDSQYVGLAADEIRKGQTRVEGRTNRHCFNDVRNSSAFGNTACLQHFHARRAGL